MPEGLSLITCTGDRPQAFDLCVRFVMRQTYAGPMQWVIVDDGQQSHREIPERPGMLVTRIFPPPMPGRNTLARNLLAAIPEVIYDRVLFFEDDDQYPATYCATMARLLDIAVSIVGCPTSRYYHLPSRRYRIMRNDGVASLCQTGMRAELLSVLANVCRESPDYIDARLWRRCTGASRVLDLTPRVVGIKGLPGRPGIGIGHRPDKMPGEWKPDADLAVLREWIGADVEMYREFL